MEMPAQSQKSGLLFVVLVIVGVLVVTCVGGAVLIGMLLPGVEKARDAARQTVVLSNQRQIMNVLMSHANQSNMQLPSQEAWVSVVTAPALGGSAALLDSPRIEGAGVDLLYSPPRRADGTMARWSDIADPSRWVLIYEDPTRLKPGTMVAAGYMDGHVQMVAPATLLQTLKDQEVPIVPETSDTPTGPDSTEPG